MIPPTCHTFQIFQKMMTFKLVVSLLSLHSVPPGDKTSFPNTDERTLRALRSRTCVQRIAQTSAGPEEQIFPRSARTRRNLLHLKTLIF